MNARLTALWNRVPANVRDGLTRTAWTALQTFVAVLLTAGALNADTLTAALTAAVAAGLAALKAVVAGLATKADEEAPAEEAPAEEAPAEEAPEPVEYEPRHAAESPGE